MKWLFATLITCLLILFLFSNDLTLMQPAPLTEVGQVMATQGNVMARSHRDDYYHDVTDSTPLTDSHHVLTGADSEATVEYGEVFKVLADSTVELKHLGKKYQVHLLNGRIERQSHNGATEFFIDGQLVDKKILSKKEANPFKGSSTSKTHSQKQDNLKKQQRQKFLSKTFRLHQRFLEKCYIKHYERKEGRTQGGQILLEFTVQKNGRLENISIKKSRFNDPDLHDCVEEVVSRVRIRQYDGPSRVVEFPIQFSLPM